MKKILLLIVCGLLTTLTAGSAMAMSLDLLSGPSLSDPSISGTTIELSSGQTSNIYLKAHTDPTTPSGNTNFDVKVKRLDSNGVVINQPIHLTTSSSTFTLNLIPSSDIVGPTPVSIGVGPGVGKDPEFYRIVVGSEDLEVKVTTNVRTLIPEFPTVAVPVAAVLGILFIIGRKKEL
jgi:hypothetical protein